MNTNYFNYKWQERMSRIENDYSGRKINPKQRASGTYIEFKLIKNYFRDDYHLLRCLSEYFFKLREHYPTITIHDDLNSFQQCLQNNQHEVTIVAKDNKVGVFIKHYKQLKSLFTKDKFLRIDKKDCRPDILFLQKEKTLSISMPEYSNFYRDIDYIGERFIAEKIYNYLTQQ